MPLGSRLLPNKYCFQLKTYLKLVPKTGPKTEPFPEPCFFRVWALEAVLRRPKKQFSANFRKNGTPIWEPFLLKIR